VIHKLSLELSKEHPSYLWAKRQSDSVNALGHIGTHIDCYTASPKESEYELEVELIRCFNGIPEINEIEKRNIRGKALILYTDVLNKFGYGTKEYVKQKLFFQKLFLIIFCL
jgi:hypothetical protein